MTKYLLDTNVLSELQKPISHPGVTAWFADVPEESLYISVITLGEIRAGIAKVMNTNPALAAHLHQWLNTLRTVYRHRLLPVTDPIADQWGQFIAQDKRQVIDALLAATAKVEGMTIVTRNVKDFEPRGIDVCNPFGFLQRL